MIRVPTIVPVVGVTFRDGLSYLQKNGISEFDRIELRHEENNPFDPNAVAVYRHTAQIGYLPRAVAERIVDELDTWAAEVCEIFSTEDGEILGLRLRLRPFAIRDCGCVLNFGGWKVRYCKLHGLEAERAGDQITYADIDYRGEKRDHDRRESERTWI